MTCNHNWIAGTLSAAGVREWVCVSCQQRVWSVTDHTDLDHEPSEMEVFQIRKNEGWGEDQYLRY